MDREVMRLRDMLSAKLSEIIYNSFWFSPEMDFLMAAIDKSQEVIWFRVYLFIDNIKVWPYLCSMAVTSIKTTYSLDVETVEKLAELARRWNVSKSAALRRAIRAATKIAPPRAEDAIRALEELQESLDLSKDLARRWEKKTRDERRASSRHLESK